MSAHRHSNIPFLLLFLLLTATSHPFASASSGNSAINRLTKSLHCPGMVISRATWFREFRARSALECASLCVPEATCASVVYMKENNTCAFSNDISRPDCSNMMSSGGSQTKFLETSVVCNKEGEMPGPRKCVCAEGYRGTPCTPYIADCTEGFANGNFTDKTVNWIFPLAAPAPFPVFCRLGTNPRTYIMDRRLGNIPFNRSFAEYQAGFGTLDGDHFLGLQQLHYLTASKRYELRVSAQLVNGTNLFSQYYPFFVSGPDDDFRLYAELEAFSPNQLGDCFISLSGARFSTYDRDNDGVSAVHCAQKHGGGFWFSGTNCTSCNPTGPWVAPTSAGERTGVNTEVFWTNSLGNAMPVKISFYLVYLPPEAYLPTTIAP